MTDLLHEWLSPQGIIALGVIYGAIKGWRNGRQLDAIHKATNSIVTVALAAKDEAGKAMAAAGVAEGREQGRAEAEAKKP
jgi:hypothetical protein